MCFDSIFIQNFSTCHILNRVQATHLSLAGKAFLPHNDAGSASLWFVCPLLCSIKGNFSQAALQQFIHRMKSSSVSKPGSRAEEMQDTVFPL